MTQSNRLWAIGSITAIVAIFLAGWFLAAQPLIASAQAADAERSSVDAQNAINEAAIAQLTIDNKKLSQLQKDYEVLTASIPSSSDTSAFITGLNTLAVRSAVQIAGITISPPKAYTVPISGAAPIAPDATSGTATATAPPVAPVAPSGPVATTSPLITPDNFVGILVTVGLNGDYDAVLTFVKGLQADGRLFLVTGFSSAKDVNAGAGVDDQSGQVATGSNMVSAKITGYIYVIKS